MLAIIIIFLPTVVFSIECYNTKKNLSFYSIIPYPSSFISERKDAAKSKVGLGAIMMLTFMSLLDWNSDL